jgi:hypothetical protein
MFISDHARRRFTLRICATVDPAAALIEVYHASRPANNTELAIDHCTPRAGYSYRVGVYCDIAMILVIGRERIVTILDRQSAPLSTRHLRRNHKRGKDRRYEDE